LVSDGTVLAEARRAAVAAIDEAAGELVKLSKFIHANPEIALQEFKSSAACADFLEARGFKVTRGVADLPTAFEATAQNGGTGPRIAYLSEYDALPGVGHGCGHNLIAIAGIGAGLGLKAALAHLPGKVSVFGTPAEEAIGGKVIMADKGVFDGIDAAMGAHPDTVEASCPTVEGSGQALACQEVRIEFHGKPAHAAADPFNGINALDAVIQVFNGVNALRQHIKRDARFHGIITHGGDAPNIIPHYAAAEFYVRAQTRTYMNELVEKLRAISEGAALMTGARLEFTLPTGANFDMITNHALAGKLKKNLDEVGLKMPEARAEEGTGSSDWGNVSYHVPSVETSYPILDHVCTWHSQEVVDAADSDMGYGNTILVAKAMALTGVDLLADPEALVEIKEQFLKEKAIREGVIPIR
jgi:amidohydrolase